MFNKEYAHLDQAFAEQIYYQTIKKYQTKKQPQQQRISVKLNSDFLNLPLSASNSLLQQLNTIIQQLSHGKYDEEIFDSKRLSLMLSSFDAAHFTTQRYSVMMAKLNTEDIELDTKRLNKRSLLLRKLTLAATAVYGLQFKDYPVSGLLGYEKENIEQKIRQLVLNEISVVHTQSKKEINLNSDINQFIAKLVNIFNGIKALQAKKYAKTILRMERYYLTEKNSRRVIVNQSYLKKADGLIDKKIGDLRVVQIDVPLGNRLTETLKQEFQSTRIYSAVPKWFNNLDEPAREWFRSWLPKPDEENWHRFEALNPTSEMQHVPGLKHARVNYLFLFDQASSKLLSVSRGFKMATLVPINIEDLSEKERVAKLNAEQLLDVLCCLAVTGFEQHWGVSADKLGITPLIFIHSLLSDIGGKLADTEMVRIQNQALQEQLKQPKYAAFSVVVANDATNILRKVIDLSNQIKKTLGNADNDWGYVDQIVDYAKKLLAKIAALKKAKKIVLTEKHNTFCRNISSAILALKRLKNLEEFEGRNKNAMKSALVKLLLNNLGAIHSTNCKSGKDRTQLDELTTHTLSILLECFGFLAQYDDIGEKRSKFIKVYAELFKSMKTFEVAAANADGAFGLKDEAKVLCQDIIDCLREIYKASNKRAGLNKPSQPAAQNLLETLTLFPKAKVEKRILQRQVSDLKREYSDPVAKSYILWKKNNSQLFQFKEAFTNLDFAMQVYYDTLNSASASDDVKKGNLVLVKEQLQIILENKEKKFLENEKIPIKSLQEVLNKVDEALSQLNNKPAATLNLLV